MPGKPRGKPFSGADDPRNGPPIHEQEKTRKTPKRELQVPPDDGAPQS